MTIVIYQLKFLPKRLDIADTIIYCSCRLKQGESLKAVSLFDNHHITISHLPNLLIVHITSLIESQVQIQIVKMVWTFCRPQITCSKVPEVLYSFNLVCLFQQVWVHFQMYPNFVFVTPWFHFAHFSTLPLSTHSNPPSNTLFFDPHFSTFTLSTICNAQGIIVLEIKRKASNTVGSAKPFIGRFPRTPS